MWVKTWSTFLSFFTEVWKIFKESSSARASASFLSYTLQIIRKISCSSTYFSISCSRSTLFLTNTISMSEHSACSFFFHRLTLLNDCLSVEEKTTIPALAPLKYLLVNWGDCQDVSPVVGPGDGVELLLARGVPDHQTNILASHSGKVTMHYILRNNFSRLIGKVQLVWKSNDTVPLVFLLLYT